MDDYVTKPVVPAQFYATVVKWMVEKSADAEVDAPRDAAQPDWSASMTVPIETTMATNQPTPSGDELLDLSVLTQLTRRNPKMMREIASVFLAFMDRTLTEFDAALVAGDRGKLSALGHKAKSSAGAVGAKSMSKLCHDLEVGMKDPAVGLEQARQIVAEIRAQMIPIAEKLGTVAA